MSGVPGINVGDNNGQWKGDGVSRPALHDWVKYHLGPASDYICQDCEKRDAYDWANISGKYHRDLDDFKALCRPCHSKFDDYVHRGWSTKRIRGYKPSRGIDGKFTREEKK